MLKPTLKYALIHALSAAAYIALVALLMNEGNQLFGKVTGGVIAFIAFLLTFVISAATMGLLIFARPVMWYLNGKKKDALSLAIYTVGFLILIAILLFTILIVVQTSY